jgi:hypothetical protein
MREGQRGQSRLRRVGASVTGLGPPLARVLDAADRYLPARGRQLVATYGLCITFVIVATTKALDFVRQNFLGIDLRIYRAAAHAVLTGQNPWPSGVSDTPFAATPPAILAYIPAALMPDAIAGAAYAALSVAAALFVIRNLRLPIWWLLFPPVFESILVLNPDVFVIALLVAGPRIAALAIPVKLYAAVPLLLQGRRSAVAAGLLISALAGPTWILFLAQFASVSDKLSAQSLGGLSAWGTWLMAPTVIALIMLRRRGASWLAVPGLWPYTQLHYSSIALPVVAGNPMLAFLFSFGIPLFPAGAIVLYAAQMMLLEIAKPYRGAPASAAQPAASTVEGRTARAPSS